MKLMKSVWLSESAHNQVDLNNLNNPESSIWFSYTDIDSDMSKYGCTLIGTAVIEVDMIDRNKITLNAVESIKKRIQVVRAESEHKITNLQDQINKLLAITNEV